MPITVGDGFPSRKRPQRGDISRVQGFLGQFPNPIQELSSLLGKLEQGGGGGGGNPFADFYNTTSGGPTTSMGEPGGLASLLLKPLSAGMRNNNPAQKRAEPGEQELSPVQVALQQLDALMNQGTPMPTGPSQQDLQQALQEAAAGISKQYGAEIGAIRSQNAGARQDVRVGSGKVRDMYGALARSYNKMGQRQFKQGSKLSRQLQNMGKREGNIVTNQAKDINQAALQGAAGLGLAGLGSELVQGTNKRAQRLSSNAVDRGTMAARTEKQVAGNNRTYMQSSGQASRLEGTNRAADMYAQLQDYLQANRSQIASLVGERASAIAQAKAGLQSSFADAQGDYAGMQAEQQQQLIDNKMAMLELALKIQADQRAGRKGNDTKDRLEDFYGMLPDQIAGPSRLLGQMNDPTVTSLYEDLSTTVPMRYGYTGQKQDDTDIPLEGNLAELQRFVQGKLGGPTWNSLSTAQRNALLSALLLQLEG